MGRQFLIKFALDRITTIQESKKKFVSNKSIDFNEYFENNVSVTLSNAGVVQDIVLKVSNILFLNIQTNPIHGLQKLKKHVLSNALITLEVIPNYELESLILSKGAGVEILYPKSLCDKSKNGSK